MKMIEQDKANHYIAGNVIYLIAAIWLSPLLAFAPVLLIALVKEFRDKMGYGQVSIMDVAWTVAGGVIPFVIQLLK